MTQRSFSPWPIWLLAVLFLLPAELSFSQTGNDTCLDCHDDAEMVSERGLPVGIVAAQFQQSIHGDLDCTDCHSGPGDYDDVPHYRTYQPVDCSGCHDDVVADFKGSVHEDFLADRDMTCATCHAIHLRDQNESRPLDGCGTCHDDVAADYETSVHRAGRKRSGQGAATCASCHGSHHVLAVADSTAMVNERNVPVLCGECHAQQPPVTKDFVRLPTVVPGYLESVHGKGWKEGKHAAVCTSCHGAHDSRLASNPKSHIHRQNIPATCGQCHDQIAREYEASIHGKAAALGVEDAPTCNDCHNEHLVRAPRDPGAPVSAEHRAREVCGTCHTDPEILSKYGITGGVVETYLDSYHGWAVERGSELVATCTDCHNVHEIRSTLDPASSVHDNNVTATCARCHENSNARFAQSYTHVGALQARSPQGWVRYVYRWLIAVVLGGMALHNIVIARWELRRHLQHVRREPVIQRWYRAERVQHAVLLVSFTGLAVTGFALRFPDSWWARLIQLDGHEIIRAYLHRAFGVIMTVTAIYHGVWLGFTRRGRWAMREMVPRFHDMRQAGENMAFHLGLKKTRPAFRAFDYTQKAEYWAVIWGTWLMAITGLILWYPAVATGWLPVWVVRVSEAIHFYEAILAVSAIVIWHFFFVIFLPTVYPMSTTWLDGRMPASEWKEHHRGEYEELGEEPVSTTGPSGEQKT